MAQDISKITQKVQDATLEMLRGQRDDQQLQQLSGKENLNPQQFFNVIDQQETVARRFQLDKLNAINAGKRHTVLGPIVFTNRFATPPDMSFGQISTATVEPTKAQTATNYVPFIVDPYVFSWRYANGEVDGFWLGVYARTNPPKGLQSHLVSWIALGRGSRYSADHGLRESWTSGYDRNTTDYLHADIPAAETNE